VWPICGLLLLHGGGLLLWVFSHRYHPPADIAEKYPSDSPDWNTFLFLGSIGVLSGIAYWWLWYRFAIKRALTRNTWNIGLGLILSGAAFFFLTGRPGSGIVFLVVLAVWAQGFTRQHFDKL
jgi:hypothetical protein